MRPLVERRPIAGQTLAVPTRESLAAQRPSSLSQGFQPDPYIDYGRYLTPGGGILILYKDIDSRFRHTLWRLLAWTLSTGFEAIYLAPYTPIESEWFKIVLLLALAYLNWLIVKKPVEIYRRIEIRPDCLILEDCEVFWTRFMENGFPAFHPGADGTKVLSGIYGTRFVEYLTVRSFDEYDRAPDVFATHLSDAMRQQWSRAR